MHTQIVMDRSGDTQHAFNPRIERDIIEAEKRFRELTGKGFLAVVPGRAGQPGTLLKAFDKTAPETLFIPPLQGG